METIRKTVRLHQAQLAFTDSTALYRAFVGGRGTGKSYVGALDLILRARPGRTYMVVGPTYASLADSSMRSFLSIARELGVLSPGDFKRSPPPQAVLSTGATILFRSADDPDRLRGSNLSGAWLDEAAQMSRDAYDIVIACLREGGETGWLSATTTPNGLTHWTCEKWGRPSPDTETFHARTEDNPFLPAEFAETIRRQYTGLRAAQELEGRFVEMEGAEWPAEFFEHASFWFDDWPSHFAVKTIGIDPSKGRDARTGDYSAIVCYGVTAEGVEYVEADLAVRPPNAICQAVAARAALFRPDGVMLEANAWQDLLAPMLREAMADAGSEATIHLTENTVPKPVRIRRLTEPLSQRKIRFRRNHPGTALLVAQLRDFPEGEHDDGPDGAEMARRLALQLLTGRGRRPPGRLAT